MQYLAVYVYVDDKMLLQVVQIFFDPIIPISLPTYDGTNITYITIN